jgi:hypothetical protein
MPRSVAGGAMAGNLPYRDYQRRVEARRLGRSEPSGGRETDSPEGELNHLRIHAHLDATRESPRWVVLHHHTPDGTGDWSQHEFTDGVEMLRHIGRHAHVPGFEEEEEKKENEQ